MSDRPIRALLIDDDEDDCLLTQALLRRVVETRYEIDVAQTWEEGLSGLKAGAHDVYLLDQALGARTGVDLLHELGPELTSVRPIIVLTGTGNRRTDVDAMKAGAADYLVKGQATASELDRSIRYAIERAGMVAELRRQTGELTRSNRELEQFARSVSHDLKGPLTIIVAHLELLQLDHSVSEIAEARQSIEQSLQAAERMVRCIDELLDHAAGGPGRTRFRSADLNVIAQAVLDYFSGEILATRAHVQVDSLPQVHADPVQLEQLLRNLVGNALKFAGGAPPSVHIWAERVRDGWQIHLRDQGLGIPADETRRVFELGQRGSNVRRISGTGLGLAICRRIALEHNGNLTVHSELGKFTEFTLELPATPPD